MSLLGKRYAEALYALAKGQGAADAVGGDLRAIAAALALPGAKAMLTSPDMTPPERQRLLDKLVAGRHPILKNTVGVLLQRRRLEVLFDLPAAFEALAMAERGEVAGTAEAAHVLSEAELQSLQQLAARLTGKQVKLTALHQADLLGGVRLRLGNVLYDGSLRAQLEQLQQKLMQATV